MRKPIQPVASVTEIASLNDDDLLVDELEARLELALLTIVVGQDASDSCDCHCLRLRHCDVFCPRPPV